MIYPISYRRRYKLDQKTTSGPKNDTAYNKVFTLTIINFSAKDVGTYICVSRNVVGRKEKSIRVYCKKIDNALKYHRNSSACELITKYVVDNQFTI